MGPGSGKGLDPFQPREFLEALYEKPGVLLIAKAPRHARCLARLGLYNDV
jgi:hypothetical protein